MKNADLQNQCSSSAVVINQKVTEIEETGTRVITREQIHDAEMVVAQNYHCNNNKAKQ